MVNVSSQHIEKCKEQCITCGGATSIATGSLQTVSASAALALSSRFAVLISEMWELSERWHDRKHRTLRAKQRRTQNPTTNAHARKKNGKNTTGQTLQVVSIFRLAAVVVDDGQMEAT